MAMEPGGRADKLGNEYERLWVVYQLLHLLADEVTSVTWESPKRDASREACKRNEFGYLGLADAVTMVVSQDAMLVLTDDFTLARTLEGAGVAVLNFNHIRTLMWED